MESQVQIYFIDVGQGTSQVVLFPDGSLVVIDCGRDSWPLIKLLERIRKGNPLLRIPAVILSHLHDDHAGGAFQLLRSYKNIIDHVYIPYDRSPDDLLANPVVAMLESEIEKGATFTIESLIRNGPSRGQLHPPLAKELLAKLSIEFPTTMQANRAQVQADPNQASGILMIECGKCRVLFPGDAGVTTFTPLQKRLGGRLQCDILAAPHHGGKLTSNAKKNLTGHTDAYSWLFNEILEVKYAIFSVGTSNNHGHPKPDHVNAVRQSGSHILCTQLTNECHPNPEQIKPSLLPVVHPSACSNNGTGCAGTIVAMIDETTVEIGRFDDHQQMVDNLAKSQVTAPLCRRVSPSGLTTHRSS